MAHSRAILKMTSRGTVTIPKDVRKDLGEDTIFEAVRREDGVIELRPQSTVDASQRWFWTDRWQRMEREADADIAAGRLKVFETMEDFLADLDDSAPSKAQTHGRARLGGSK